MDGLGLWCLGLIFNTTDVLEHEIVKNASYRNHDVTHDEIKNREKKKHSNWWLGNWISVCVCACRNE